MSTVEGAGDSSMIAYQTRSEGCRMVPPTWRLKDTKRSQLGESKII